jgi:ribosomal protein S18 acetylase RimI-like enzyme
MKCIADVLTTITDRARDCTAVIAQEGWRRGLQRVVKEVLPLPFRRIEYVITARLLTEPIAIPQPRLPVTIRLATPADLDKFNGVATFSELKAYAKRFARGHICFVALYQDKLVGYNWAAAEVDPELEGAPVRLQPGDAYVGYAFTAPAYRGQRIAPAMSAHRLRYLQEKGYRRAIAIVDVKNKAAQTIHRRVGYQEVDRATFQRILWWRTFRYHSDEKTNTSISGKRGYVN